MRAGWRLVAWAAALLALAALPPCQGRFYVDRETGHFRDTQRDITFFGAGFHYNLPPAGLPRESVRLILDYDFRKMKEGFANCTVVNLVDWSYLDLILSLGKRYSLSVFLSLPAQTMPRRLGPDSTGGYTGSLLWDSGARAAYRDALRRLCREHCGHPSLAAFILANDVRWRDLAPDWAEGWAAVLSDLTASLRELATLQAIGLHSETSNVWYQPRLWASPLRWAIDFWMYGFDASYVRGQRLALPSLEAALWASPCEPSDTFCLQSDGAPKPAFVSPLRVRLQAPADMLAAVSNGTAEAYVAARAALSAQQAELARGLYINAYFSGALGFAAPYEDEPSGLCEEARGPLTPHGLACPGWWPGAVSRSRVEGDLLAAARRASSVIHQVGLKIDMRVLIPYGELLASSFQGYHFLLDPPPPVKFFREPEPVCYPPRPANETTNREALARWFAVQRRLQPGDLEATVTMEPDSLSPLTTPERADDLPARRPPPAPAPARPFPPLLSPERFPPGLRQDAKADARAVGVSVRVQESSFYISKNLREGPPGWARSTG
eukprot:tig00001041_g6543.t1